MNIIVAYLPSDGKIPICSVKDKSNWLEEPPTNSDYVGILGENIIQIDFDNEDDAEIVKKIVERKKLRCNILETERGLHFYFKNTDIDSQSVGLYNAIGLESDIGLGNRNRVVPLRVTREVSGSRQTITRRWLQEFDELDELPAFLRPISSRDYGFKTTKTRNQTLFNYILTLQTNGFSKKDIRGIIKLINEYILHSPLDDTEIDTITRDDAFSKELFFGERGSFLHDRFGNYLLSNNNVMIIEDQVCIYNRDNLYSNNQDEFERAMLDKIPSLRDTQRKEVYKYMYLKCNSRGEYSSPKYVGLKDEILDIETMETYPYSPRFIINNKVDYNYKPEAYSEVMDKTLDKVTCNDKDLRALLEEMIGYTLYRDNNLHKAFILTGGGSNGKSTVLDLIKRLLGSDNYVSLDLRQLEETFSPAELEGKLANIGDDISPKYLEQSSVFKKVVSGESFQVQRKYGQPFDLKTYATQIFCANELPMSGDRSDGFSRRLIIVPFNARFSPDDEDFDPFIDDKLSKDDAMEYLLKLGIEGLKRVLTRRRFTEARVSEIEKANYLVLNNPILQWFDDYPKIENEVVNKVYQDYRTWCFDNGVNALKKSNVSREIRKEFGLVSEPRYIDGKTVRVYVKEEDS